MGALCLFQFRTAPFNLLQANKRKLIWFWAASSSSSSSSSSSFSKRSFKRIWQRMDNPRPISSSSSSSSTETDITGSNFWDSLVGFERKVESADFIAFDLELSGIHNFSPPESGQAMADPCQCRYLRIKEMAETFAVLQAGVSLFNWDPPSHKFVAYPYNFFIFRRKEVSLNIEAPKFLCEPSSLGFLAKHNFDFNKCFCDGISYLSKEEETKLRSHVKQNLKNRVKRDKQSLLNFKLSNTSDFIFFENVRVQISSWHGKTQLDMKRMYPTNALPGTVAGSFSNKLSSGCVPGPRPFLLLKLHNDRQEKIANLVVYRHFPDLVLLKAATRTESAEREVQVVFTESKDDLVTLEAEVEKSEIDSLHAKISEAVGFRHVIDAIINSRKPVIGHNCLIDLAHIYSKFVSPLPPTLTEFSSSLLKLFPCIIDTKHLLIAHPKIRKDIGLKNTSLDAAFQKLSGGFTQLHAQFNPICTRTRVEISVANGFKRYGYQSSEAFEHEAGYDAFMTGSVFVQACHNVGIDPSTIGSLSDTTVTGNSEISSYLNCLWISSFRMSALDLTLGKEVPQSPTIWRSKLPLQKVNGNMMPEANLSKQEDMSNKSKLSGLSNAWLDSLIDKKNDKSLTTALSNVNETNSNEDSHNGNLIPEGSKVKDIDRPELGDNLSSGSLSKAAHG